MEFDTTEHVKKYQQCQSHGPLIHAPHTLLHNVVTPWPFHSWGLDIIGPISPTSSGRYKYIITATEYSSKWVEAIPLRDYSGSTIAAFIKEYIICRFGAPMIICSDIGTSFINQTVKELLDQYSIKFHTSTVYYTQGNGQAEATNKTLLRILSRTVYDHHRGCHEQLPLALWAHRISKISSTGDSPYSLVYGEDAILPAEIAIPSARVSMAILTTPDERNAAAGKFVANWEGPYMISEAAKSGYYYLKRMNGFQINTAINGKWLKAYYA
ncbi:protein NYNRIN-like [Papaver somniferum]|uniref:protein NYNRIN-like n=1 Tax=Papaver somniferum TaxID=3469 RepID=UPI000E6F69AE|nr:protein NYNRIN-like [Papaver somniferum]